MPVVPAMATAQEIDFQKQVVPFLATYCNGCHNAAKKKGDLVLDAYGKGDEAVAAGDAAIWQDVAERLTAREMPPDDHRQPTEAERKMITSWIETIAARAESSGADPGHVTIRRLNSAEYTNTIRDLFGADLNPARNFPADDVGYGFDNIGDVLSMPPLLIERYLAAAESIATRVIAGDLVVPSRTQTFQIDRFTPAPDGSFVRGGSLILTTGSAVHTRYDFPATGEYVLRVKAFAKQAGNEPVRMTLRIDGHDVKRIDVTAGKGKPAAYTVRTTVDAGTKRVELAFANGMPAPARAARWLALDTLSVKGPLRATEATLPASHRRLIPRTPGKDTWRADAREFLAPFLARAYRRPVTADDVNRIARFLEDAVDGGESFERGMQLAVRAALMSPHFLYRAELDEGEPAGSGSAPRLIDDYALASRLSYFLWSSMPDDELFRRAGDKSLRTPEILDAEVRRMLLDPRAKALVDNFAMQWLQIRRLTSAKPDKKKFPSFDGDLRDAMLKETSLFFEEVMREDLSILTFLDADFTFLNDRLARHYGIDGVEGSAFRRVSLPNHNRGGLLTQASVLTVTSNPSRTSPVKRGRWVLEQLLGTPPPPPPPEVPELKAPLGKKGLLSAGTLRQLMETHRANAGCAVCHKKMDPLGFGLENFDAVGAWRSQDADVAIDASGVLPDGKSFDGPVALKAVLIAKQDQFRRTLARRMLTYALGRGTERFDRPAIETISRDVAANHDSFVHLVTAIVKSDPFQKQRGKGQP